MRFGELELVYFGNKQVAAMWGGKRVLPSSFVECDAGTLTAAEYVALYAIRHDRITPAVRAFVMSGLSDPGEIEYCEGIAIQ